MPDLDRERRDRAGQRLDQLVTFTVAESYFDGVGRPVTTETSWKGWGRREDIDADQFFRLGEGGVDEIGEVRLVTRYDDRFEVGSTSKFEVGGETFILSRIEEVGRRRYVRLYGVRST